MKTGLAFFLSLGLMVAVSTSPSHAADDPGTFVQKAIGINLEEIQLGELAQQKSETAAVRDYGQMLVDDHTANNQKATALAQSLGAEVPEAPSEKAQQTYQQLQNVSGAQFDEAFISEMLLGHQTAIDLFTAQVDGGDNDQVEQYASETLPALNKHLQEARDLQNDLVGAADGQ